VRVGLFVTCMVDLMRPDIGFAALRLLEAAGCTVYVPERQTCCGQPGYNSGDHEAGTALARKLADEFVDCDYIVAPSGSCAGMVRTHHPKLFDDQGAEGRRIRAMAEKTYELTDFLVRIAEVKSVPGRYDGKVTYHDSCSGLRELGVRDQPRRLLAMVPGLELVEMRDATVCCGFGGTFSIKLGPISTRMSDNKVRNAQSTGAGALVAGDLGCLLNMEGRLSRIGDKRTRVWHVAEILAGMADPAH